MRTTALGTLLAFALTTVAWAVPSRPSHETLRTVGLEETGDQPDSPRTQLASELNVPPAAMPGSNRGSLPGGVSVNPRTGLEEKTVEEKTVEELIQVLRNPPSDTSYDSRLDALYRLRNLGTEAAPAISALIELLKAGYPSFTRVAAARALGAIGPGAKEAIPALRGLWISTFLTEAEADVHRSALEAIRRIDPTSHLVMMSKRKVSEPAIRLIQELYQLAVMNPNDAQLIQQVVSALAESGPAAKPAIQFLDGIFQDFARDASVGDAVGGAPLKRLESVRYTAAAEQPAMTKDEAQAALQTLVDKWGLADGDALEVAAVTPEIVKKRPALEGLVGQVIELGKARFVIVPDQEAQQGRVAGELLRASHYKVSGGLSYRLLPVDIQGYGATDDPVLNAFERMAKSRSYTVWKRQRLVDQSFRDVLRQIVAGLSYWESTAIQDEDLDLLARVLDTLA